MGNLPGFGDTCNRLLPYEEGENFMSILLSEGVNICDIVEQ